MKRVGVFESMYKQTIILLITLIILVFQLPVWASGFAVWEGVPVEWAKDIDAQTKSSLESYVKEILQGWADRDYGVFDELYAGKTQGEIEANVDKLFAIYQEPERIKIRTASEKVMADNGDVLVVLNLVTLIPERGKGSLELSFRLKRENDVYRIASHKFTPDLEKYLPGPETYLGTMQWKGKSCSQNDKEAVSKLVADYILALNSQMPNDFVKLIKQKSLNDEAKLINALTNLPRFIKRIKGDSTEFSRIDENNINVQLKQAVLISMDPKPVYINASLNITNVDGKWYINKVINQPSFESLAVTTEKHFGDLKISCTLSPFYKDKGSEIVDLIKRAYDFYQSIGARIAAKEIIVIEDAKVAAYAQASPIGILFNSEVINEAQFIIPHEIGHFTCWNGQEHLLPEEWMNEGMANFLCWYFLNEKEGQQEHVIKELKRASDLFANPNFKAVNEIALVDTTAEKFPAGWPPGASAIYYEKGSYVLEMLRQILGSEIFVKVYNDFTNNNRILTSKALEQTVSKVTGKDYGWFFQQWVYRPGYPDLTFDYDIAVKGDVSIIKVHLKQKSDIYRLVLPLAVKTTKNTDTYTLNLTDKEQTWEIKVDGMVESVFLDPKENVFKKLTILKK